jgi:hypothetical protein
MRFYFCEVCEYFHSSFHHPRASILLGYTDANGGIIMAEENLTIDLSTLTGPVNVYASLGDLYDGPNETGNIVTDPITSAVYSLPDGNVATITSQTGTGQATLDLTLADGTTTLSVTFTCASGATGTGQATITVTGTEAAAGAAPQSVHINLSTTPPA